MSKSEPDMKETNETGRKDPNEIFFVVFNISFLRGSFHGPDGGDLVPFYMDHVCTPPLPCVKLCLQRDQKNRDHPPFPTDLLLLLSQHVSISYLLFGGYHVGVFLKLKIISLMKNYFRSKVIL